MQVTITKDVKKLKLFIIFKAQPESKVRENHRRTVACELNNPDPDAAGDECAPEDKVLLA